MKLITFNDIAAANISAGQCVQWVDEALHLKTESLLPHKASLKPEGLDGVFYNTMPCIVPGVDSGGVKHVTRYPGREPALSSELLLYDLPSGECLALMDGTWITTMRTGAVAAHTIKLLAVPDFSKIGFVGLGNTARATLLCLCAALPERHLDVVLVKYKDQHLSFAERFEAYDNLHFSFVDTPQEAAKSCQVLVSCVTVANNELASPDCFAPGSLLVPVHTRGFAECDLVFDKVFCDDESHVAGFGYYPQFKSKLKEVAEVVTGTASGRESNQERILAYNIGIALHDIYFARRIYDLVGSNLHDINLEPPKDKIWL